MAVWNISNRSQLKEGQNMLAEHYQQERLDVEALLSKISLTKIHHHFNESTVTISPTKLDANWRVYDLPDTLTNFLIGGKNPFIDPVSSNKKYACSSDFIISRLRYYLNEMAIVPESEKKVALSTEYLVFQQKTGVSPHLLLPFSLSKYVKSILKWAQTGNAHPRFSSSTFKRIWLPNVLIEKSDYFKGLIDRAINELDESRKLMDSASIAIEEKLNLASLNNINKNFYQKPFSKVISSHRLDAEHYNPQFDQLVDLLNIVGSTVSLFNNVSYCKRGKQPNYSLDGHIVLNSKHIRENKIVFSDNRFALLSGSPDQHIKYGDLLINGTGLGTIGRTAPYLESDLAIPDNHVTILRTSNFDTAFLSAFFNSKAGQIQVNKHLRGSSGQLELYPSDILKFIVWKPDMAFQKEIGDMIRQSIQKEKQAKTLLEQAKKEVETLIEQAAQSI